MNTVKMFRNFYLNEIVLIVLNNLSSVRQNENALK